MSKLSDIEARDAKLPTELLKSGPMTQAEHDRRYLLSLIREAHAGLRYDCPHCRVVLEAMGLVDRA
jgi:hypothetical protein